MHSNNDLKDFRNFLFILWRDLGLPEPTDAQYAIANQLQGEEARLMIQAFRGVGKSWVTSAFCIWLLYWNQSLNILVASASADRATQFTTFCMKILRDIPWLNHLHPEHGGNDLRALKTSFDVYGAPAAHAPSLKSVGITGQLTGSRADWIIADDIEVPNNSATPILREKLAESVKEFDAILKPGGRIVFLGTPQSQESVYSILPNRGYSRWVWPSRYPTTNKMVVYGQDLAPELRARLAKNPELSEPKYGAKSNLGAPTDSRFPEQELVSRELSYGSSGFALQFQLDCSLSDSERFPLKLDDLSVVGISSAAFPEIVRWGCEPFLEIKDYPSRGFSGDRLHRARAVEGNYVPSTASVLAIDPAGRGLDETAAVVVHALGGHFFVTRVIGLRGGHSKENLQRLADIARSEKVQGVVIEENFSDGAWTTLLKPYLADTWPTTIFPIKHYTQKEKRIIQALEPALNQHRVTFTQKALDDDLSVPTDQSDSTMTYSLLYQMTHVTWEKDCLIHDDRLDALAMAVAHLVQHLGLSPEDEKRNRDLEQFEKILKATQSGFGLPRLLMGLSPVEDRDKKHDRWIQEPTALRSE